MSTYTYPRWAEEEMRVIAPFPTEEKPRQGAWCKVAVAAGHHARVVNSKLGIDRWFHLDDLRVPVGDPHATRSPYWRAAAAVIVQLQVADTIVAGTIVIRKK